MLLLGQPRAGQAPDPVPRPFFPALALRAPAETRGGKTLSRIPVLTARDDVKNDASSRVVYVILLGGCAKSGCFCSARDDYVPYM